MIDVGARVGNYEVMEKIGEGAMGSVFLAVHPGIGKKVALKVIHPQLACNEEMVTRFFNEARFVSQLGHQNIVEVRDFGQTPDGDNFIVMELLEGVRLSDRIKQARQLPVSQALHIATQIADGLAAAHARGIVHRDLKPDNIMLVPRGGDNDVVKILDFGLAKLTGPSAGILQAKTQTGSLLGTAHYMAPEQAESSKQLDHRVDVYALGCILFELVTGRVPFPGVGFGDVLIKHIREPPTLPSRLNAQVPPSVEKIILHALAKKPEFRFKDMERFRTALRDPESFIRSLDSSEVARLTPASGSPAPNMPQPLQPQTIILPSQPASQPTRLDSQSRTVMGEAPQVVTLLGTSGPPLSEQATLLPQPNRLHRPAVASPRRPPPSNSKVGLIVGIFVTLLVLGGGGAFFFFGGKVSAMVVSEPAGAEVSDGQTVLGETPLEVARKRGTLLTLTVKKEGFLSAQRQVTFEKTQEIKIVLRTVPEPEKAVDDEDKPTPTSALGPKSKVDSKVQPKVDSKPQTEPKAKLKPRSKRKDSLILIPSF